MLEKKAVRGLQRQKHLQSGLDKTKFANARYTAFITMSGP